jgi:hypothetical protein
MRLFATGYGRFQKFIDFFDAPDADGKARNTIAAIVVGNIPFYPFYLALIVGWRAWPSLFAVLTLPLFALVPLVGRRSAALGQWMLLSASILDTGLCAIGLGVASGVAFYFAPIALLPIVLYRDASITIRAAMVGAVALTAIVTWIAGAGLQTYSTPELKSMVTLHTVSVLLLTCVILVLRWRLPPRAPVSA